MELFRFGGEIRKDGIKGNDVGVLGDSFEVIQWLFENVDSLELDSEVNHGSLLDQIRDITLQGSLLILGTIAWLSWQ